LQSEQTKQAYSKVGTDLVVFSLGVITGEIKQFKTTFTGEMAEAGKTFLDTLRTTDILAQDAALQDFFLSLFTQKRCGEADKYSLLTYAFLVVYSFSVDGTLRRCNMFSQYFSKAAFFCRGALFNAINAQAQAEDRGFFE
jgi:hypothetical protein